MIRPAVPAALALVLLAACGGDARPGAADTAAAAPSVPADNAAPAAAVPERLVDPNTATPAELAAVPGLDSASVATLLARRPFPDMLAVDRALGSLSPDQRKAVYAHLWKPINLNTAKKEEILLIPGVGPRMQHEFEEYRPYRSIEQFRREIGKYVDEQEVARLEMYVGL